MRSITAAVLLASLTSGCTTGTSGVVQIGPDHYMLGGLGKFTDFSSSGVKARLYEDAYRYCNQMNRTMVPANSTGKDSAFGQYASAEIQFYCLDPADPRAAAK